MDYEKEKERIASNLTSESAAYTVYDLLDQYSDIKTLEAFANTPPQLYSGGKKAKEIALNAALTVFTPHNATAEDIVKAADTIFNWLTK